LAAQGEFDNVADPVDHELVGLGRNGEAIQHVRAEVIALLSEENSCSAWFRTAEPEAVAKFRSLRFAVDSAGPADVLKLDSWPDPDIVLQPYVARTGQNVGWGSTITFNANGAFFREVAYFRIRRGPADLPYEKPFHPLVVGNFAGASPGARILTMLHELGHVLDMLPIDSGIRGGPVLSVHNTQAVYNRCGSQIRAHAKHLRKSEPSKSLASPSAMAGHTSSQLVSARMRDASLELPLLDLTQRSASFSTWLDGGPLRLAAARRKQSDTLLPAPLP
jgi:hypothetical protein